jgi:membrane protease YdiL (CAAX protease family)
MSTGGEPPDSIPASPRAEEQADRAAGARARAPHAGRQATPGRAISLFLILFALLLILGVPLQQRFGLEGLALVQLIFVLGGSSLYAWGTGLSRREVLGERRVRPDVAVGAALLGSSVWFIPMAVILPLQSRILPPPEEFLRERETLFSQPHTLGGWLILWGIAALTPAICEEILFRGVLLSSSRPRLGDLRAVVLVSGLFALFHMNPYQLSITFLLGLVMGGLRVKTGSILSPMLFHLLNNTVILLLARRVADLPAPVALLMIAAMGLGLALVLRGAERLPTVRDRR